MIFFFLKAMDNFSSEVESDRYIIESVGKFFCCKNTLKISQASLSSRAWHRAWRGGSHGSPPLISIHLLAHLVRGLTSWSGVSWLHSPSLSRPLCVPQSWRTVCGTISCASAAHFRTSLCQPAGLGSVSDLAGSGACKILRDYVVGDQKWALFL